MNVLGRHHRPNKSRYWHKLISEVSLLSSEFLTESKLLDDKEMISLFVVDLLGRGSDAANVFSEASCVSQQPHLDATANSCKWDAQFGHCHYAPPVVSVKVVPPITTVNI